MTAALTRRQADQALDALALTIAAAEGTAADWQVILQHADPADLVLGLVILAASFRVTAAAASGSTTTELDAQMRSMYLTGSAA